MARDRIFILALPFKSVNPKQALNSLIWRKGQDVYPWSIPFKLLKTEQALF